MNKISEEISIKSPISKVFAAAETYPLFVKSFKERKILSSSSTTSKVRITNIFLGIPLTWEGEGLKVKDKEIRWTQTRGLLKGLKANWLFQAHSNQITRVVIQTTFIARQFSGHLLYRLSYFSSVKTAKIILNALKITAEKASL